MGVELVLKVLVAKSVIRPLFVTLAGRRRSAPTHSRSKHKTLLTCFQPRLPTPTNPVHSQPYRSSSRKPRVSALKQLQMSAVQALQCAVQEVQKLQQLACEYQQDIKNANTRAAAAALGLASRFHLHNLPPLLNSLELLSPSDAKWEEIVLQLNVGVALSVSLGLKPLACLPVPQLHQDP